MSIDFAGEAMALQSELVERRRDFHRHPEPAFQETRTAGIVAAQLSELGIEVRPEIGRTGVVGLLDGHRDGPTVLVRADMDALPIHEAGQSDYASRTPGVMHACGHDGHTSIGLAVARILSNHRSEFDGRIKFVFQPAEEIGDGAAAMVADGVLENPRPDFSIGLHLWNELPVGQVSVTPGPCMASADVWHCTITGYGGHGALPHLTQDPIVAAAQIVSALQTIVSRNLKPLEGGVVSVGSIHGGDAFNVIPPLVKLEGTIRTYQPETRQMIHQRLVDICEGMAASMSCRAEVDIALMTPAVVNDPAVAEQIAAIAARHVGEQNIRHDICTMGSEDMSRLMEDIPGCYFFVGSANSERRLDFPHHNPRFDFDEQALTIGTAILAEAAASLAGYKP
ncbi:MAG: amidohydrolase [Anaerolineae bacterium]|nr:amidohydrolase [Anaerolineae bacterium]